MVYARNWGLVALRRPALRRLYEICTTSIYSARPSSLSAIHRGIRQSESVQYGEPREPRSSRRLDFENSRGRRRSNDRRIKSVAASSRDSDDSFTAKFRTARTARTDSISSTRQQQKLRKKMAKKDAEKEEEEESGRRTRRKRFIDSETEFGKKSLVYRLKYGDLKEKADQLQLQEFVKPESFRSKRRRDLVSDEGEAPERHFGTEQSKPWQRPQNVSQGEEEAPRHRYGSERSDRFERFTRPEPRAPRYNGDRHNEFSQDETRGTGDRYRGKGERNTREGTTALRGPKKEMMAMTLKYTTAASQFLYGRSVVKAALEQDRRKLYNLYIYGGENRKDSKDNTIMTRLAKKQGVPITIVPNDEQRIMDKMSMGRPHNGFVLEASPLPRLPITSLGRLEESVGKLGFHVNLDFQSKEEEAINGSNTFVRRANDLKAKPFVLLLNEVVDPGNLGGIIRTASYLGVDAVGITNRGSSTLTPVVLKSAAGAVEEITLFTVDDPAKFLEESRKSGWKTYAAVAPPDRKLARKHGEKFITTDEVETRDPLSSDPCVLVLGNEGYGLSKDVKMVADYELSVPRFLQNSCIDSLNVSVAAGLLCHAFVREPRVPEQSATEKTASSNEAAPEKEAVEKEVELVF